MNKKLITILLLSVVLTTACSPKEFWNDLKNLKFKTQQETTVPYHPPVNNTNTTNETIVIKEPFKLVQDHTNIIITKHSILIWDNNESYLIDAPNDQPDIINYLNEFKIKRLNFIISTLDTPKHNGGIKYIVVKTPPDILMDNGIINDEQKDYLLRLERYNTYWNNTPTQYYPLLADYKHKDFNFFVPYDNGLREKKQENSISISYKQELLYMSDCYGDCEKTIPPISARYLILANEGICPSNSFDFVLSTGAEYIIGNSICNDLKEDLDIINIKYLSLSETGNIQLVLGDEDEIRREND